MAVGDKLLVLTQVHDQKLPEPAQFVAVRPGPQGRPLYDCSPSLAVLELVGIAVGFTVGALHELGGVQLICEPYGQLEVPLQLQGEQPKFSGFATAVGLGAVVATGFIVGFTVGTGDVTHLPPTQLPEAQAILKLQPQLTFRL